MQALGRGAMVRWRCAEEMEAAVKVQQWWRQLRERRFMERIGIAEKAVSGIQAFARGRLVRERVWDLRGAVSVLEERWKTALVARRAKAEYMRKRAAVVVLQRVWRRHAGSRAERRAFLSARSEVIGTQAAARGCLARWTLQRNIRAVVAAQQRIRQMFLTRNERTRFISLRAAAITVQRRRRDALQARTDKDHYSALIRAVATIKMRFLHKRRVRTAALVLQRAWRERAWIVRLNRTGEQATQIQRMWRGYRVRRELPPRLRVVLKRLRKVAVMREEETLGARTRAAVELVKTRAGAARGVAALEPWVSVSRECARIVAADEEAWVAVVGVAERGTGRGASAAAGVLRACVECVPGKSALAGRGVGWVDGLVGAAEKLKGSVGGSAGFAVLVTVLGVIATVCEDAELGRRIRARKRLVEKLMGVCKEVEDGGRRRGAVEGGRGVVVRRIVSALTEK